MALVSSASRGNNPVKGRARSLFIPDRNYCHYQISRGRRRRIQENFAEQADCWSGISRICRKIDSRVNVRIDTQPPGYGSEPHLDFIVTDLDGMLARLCGPDRKIIRLRDKRGIYLFLIEITVITKYLADADGGSRRILRSRPDCWSGISEICWNIDSQVLRADRRSRRPGLGGARLRRPLRRSARSDRVAGAVRGADLAFPETRGERRGAGSAAFVCGTVLSGQAIARFGIAVAVWLNAGLLAATALAARLVPDRHRRLADEIRPQRPPLGDRRFGDSFLERDGSELPVPVRQAKLTRSCR